MNGETANKEIERSSEEKKEKEVGESLPDDVQAAIEMLSQMEISKKENSDSEKYKASLLSSELISNSTFEELNIPPSIIEVLYGLEFKYPSMIQKTAVPEIAKGGNVAFQSNSGSGKTIAFVVGALMKLELAEQRPQVIIIAPTRDISRQIYEVLEKFKSAVKFESLLALGDQIDRDKDVEAQVVVGPPGTVKFLIQKRINVSHVKMVILDEADALLTDEMGTQTLSAVRKIPSKQLVLFSATFSEEMKTIILTVAKDIKTFYLEKESIKPDNISQFYMEVGERDKIKTLMELYSMIPTGQSIVFVFSRDKAERVQKTLKEDGFDASVLHGQLAPEERDRVITGFKKGDIKVLITTNVLSRGLDVPQLNLAVNYDLPRTLSGHPDLETYVHRIGRTGRFNRAGVSVTFVSGSKEFQDLLTIQKSVNGKIKYITLKSLEAAIMENLKLQK